MSNSITRVSKFPYNEKADGNLTELEIDQIVNTINNADSGVSPWAVVKTVTLTATGTTTLTSLVAAGNIAMGGFKLTGLGAGSASGDSLRYEQLIGLYLLLSGGTMSGAIAMGTNKVTGLASASASGDALSWGQAFTSGTITFSPTTSGVKGTTANDNATAGNVGEYVESVVGQTNAPATTVYGDLTSISLTAGDWDVSLTGVWLSAGATWVDGSIGISTTSGNSGTGLVSGSNSVYDIWASSSTTPTAVNETVAGYRMSLASTTTVYYKYKATYSAGTPALLGRISARRMR